MLKRIELILNTNPDSATHSPKGLKKHVRKFMGLRSSPLFKRLGLGFFLHLLRGEDLSQFINIFALLKSEGEKGLSFFYGDGSKHNLFKTMRAAQLPPSIQSYNYKQIQYPKGAPRNQIKEKWETKIFMPSFGQ